ncbi:MAG: hypothetical protein ACKVT1_07575 [Dehalococcoidia bacterium]
MPTTLTDVRDRVRKDLHDTDAANYRWPDAQLDRHIDHALSELSAAMPQEKTLTVATTAGSRDLSTAALADLVEVETVEYPVAQFPPAYVDFASWATTLTLDIETAPAGANAKLFYTARHQLDGAGTTLSAFQVDVLVTGASAYAALEQSAFTVDRVTTGEAVAAGYGAYGRARLTAFRQLLHQYGRRNRVRGRRLYVPA